MTQSVSNTLNNLEQMLSSQKQDFSINLSEKPTNNMDKTTDFKKVFEATINSERNSSQETENTKIFTKNSINSKDFRDILKKATDEANVETSLDLTLAKDINEIITQLKEAVENATELTENTQLSDLEDIIETAENTIALVDPELTYNSYNQDMPPETIEETQNIELNNLWNKDLAFNSFKTADSESITNSVELEIENTNEIIEFSENPDSSVEITNTNKTENSSNLKDLESLLEEDLLKDLNIENIEAETGSTKQETFMQNQTPEENALKAIINNDSESFEPYFEPIKTQNNQVNQSNSNTINPSKIIDQISKHIENLHNNSKVNIVLNPESLGKVNIQLLTTKDGLSAQFTVTTQEARDLIMKGLDNLKDTLTSQGIGVDNVSVKVADAQKSEYKQDWTDQEGSRGGNKEQNKQNKEEKEKNLFENTMKQTINEENGNV